MLCTAKADALCAEPYCLSSILRIVGIGADLECAILVSPSHITAEIAGNCSLNCLDSAVINLTG